MEHNPKLARDMGVLAFPHPPLAAGRLAAKLLSRHSAHEIAEAIEVLVDVLDLLGGDPDAEDNGDAEPTGDELDMAWPEWRGRGEQRSVGNLPHEDDEDDDPAEDDDPSGQCDEDEANTGSGNFVMHGSSLDGPGCYISEPGI